jgi:hypothetical protein
VAAGKFLKVPHTGWMSGASPVTVIMALALEISSIMFTETVGSSSTFTANQPKLRQYSK